MTKYFIVLGVMIGGVSPLWAMDGTQWREMSKEAQDAYVHGVVDDWVHTIVLAEQSLDVSRERKLGMDVFSITEELLFRLGKCVTDQEMRYSQIIATVNKYLDDHPDELKLDMAGHVFIAMAEACQIRKELKP